MNNIATYENVSIDNLKQFNYFFGSNGVGKTTISRIIENENDSSNLNKNTANIFDTCKVNWLNNNKMQAFVYNVDFVNRNFGQQLKGIFTLGSDSKNAQEKIETIRKEIENIGKDVDNLRQQCGQKQPISGKYKKLDDIETRYKEEFWKLCKTLKKSYEYIAENCLKGFVGDSSKFKNQVLQKYDYHKNGKFSNNLDIGEISKKAKVIFDKTIIPIAEIVLDTGTVNTYEKSALLQEVIVGKKDVEIGAMIESIGNSDWVKQGVVHLQKSKDKCPFCQQKLLIDLKKQLENYFDASFEQKKSQIDSLLSNYTIQVKNIIENFDKNLDDEKYQNFLEVKTLKDKRTILDTLTNENINEIKKKQENLSTSIILKDTQGVLGEILSLIGSANEKIDKQNQMVQNRNKEQKDLMGQVWEYIVSQQKDNIENYLNQKDQLEKGIKCLEEKIKGYEDVIAKRQIEIGKLEKQITSIKPICDGINNILKNFGFTSFKLEISKDEKNYSLKRNDGSVVKNDLSEGEKNFLCFIYFYYLLQGGFDNTQTMNDRIVIIDDPVSSLDNDILFVVSTLVRRIIESSKENNNIKQIFFLTHNIYFFKQVTYRANNKEHNKYKGKQMFYVVKKLNDNTQVALYEDNPIKTGYELLWNEIRELNCNKATIQNTMRRIIEDYFKLLGGLDIYKDIIDKFDESDKIIVNSLLAFEHAGSHSSGVLDDIYFTTLDDGQVAKYKNIFREIFEKSNHIAHYNMMMNVI